MTTKSNSAIQERQKKRERKLTNAKKNAITLLKQKIKISNLIASTQPQTEFNNFWTEFDKTLKEKHECKNHVVYAQAYNHALKHTQKEIEQYELDITFPKYIILEKRAKLFRTPDWFQDAKKTREFYKKWMNQFEESNKEISKYDVFLSLTLHSGILQSIVLKSIFVALDTNNLQMESLFGLPFISVSFTKNGYSTNIKVINNDDRTEERLTQQNVYISPLSARILHLYQKQNLGNNSSEENNSELPEVNIEILYQNIRHFFNDYTELPASLMKYLKACIYVIEHHKRFTLPEFFLYLMLGEQKSYSLPTSNWQVIISEQSYPVKSLEHKTIEFMEYNASNPSSKKPNKHLARDISQLFKSDENKNTQKVSKRKFEVRLENLITKQKNNNAPVNEMALLTWLDFKQETNQPSSLKTYSDRITNRWLALTYDEDINNYDEADYEDLYAEIISLSSTEKAKNDTAKLLDSLHEHIVNEYGAEPLEPMSEGTIPHVKAGYVSEIMFKAIIDACDELDLSPEFRISIKVAITLGQRCGLRVGEITKIRLKDITIHLKDNSAEFHYIDIRNNKFGNNKTTSALRTIPIDILLLPADKKILEQLYWRRKIEQGQTLISDKTGRSIPKNELSQIISKIIKNVTGLTYLTAHSLRHSFISNMQLTEFFKNFNPYKQEQNITQIKALRKLLPDYKNSENSRDIKDLFGNNKSISNFVIAGLAGHAEPGITLNTYVHFTDIQIGLQLNQLDYELTKAQKQNLIKLPRRKMSMNNHGINHYQFTKAKAKPLQKLKKNSKASFQNKKSRKKVHGFNEVIAVLESYQNHNDYQRLLDLYDITSEKFEHWKNKALIIKNDPAYQTQLKTPRLFSKEQTGMLVPTHRLATNDNLMMQTMKDKFERLYNYKKRKPELQWFVKYTLQNCQYLQNHINLTSFKDFDMYFEYLLKLLPKQTIYLEIHSLDYCRNKREFNKWNHRIEQLDQANIKKTQSSKDKSKKVSAKISIISQKYNNQNHHSCRVLQVFCFNMFLLLDC